MNTQWNDHETTDAPWLVVPLLLAVVLISGLAVIFGWGAAALV